MKLSYKIVGGSSYVTLADETSNPAMAGSQAPDGVHDFPPSFTAVHLEEPSFGGTPIRRTQGNVKCQATVSWNAYYTDRASALTAIRTIASALMDQQVHFKVEEGSETQYYPNAVVESYNPKPEGRAVEHSLTFSSDNVTSVAQ